MLLSNWMVCTRSIENTKSSAVNLQQSVSTTSLTRLLISFVIALLISTRHETPKYITFTSVIIIWSLSTSRFSGSSGRSHFCPTLSVRLRCSTFTFPVSVSPSTIPRYQRTSLEFSIQNKTTYVHPA